ncbi:MAG: NAD(P)H-binding protein [Alphaproteobacteria bacterium]|nr:NAD(P)H-binding protein [Alphaproteobacteria bacterium]
MKIAVFGAAGEVGSRIVEESLERGHNVLAVVRRESQCEALQNDVEPFLADAMISDDVVKVVKKADFIISALRPVEGLEFLLPQLTDNILKAAREFSKRAVIVGGAASLKIPGDPDGHTVLSSPDFLPISIRDIALACQMQFDICQKHDVADWTYICPPAMLTPGERTGSFRLGKDELVQDQAGNSAISMEDFAIACLDEAEQGTHLRQRFTVGY